MLVMEHHLIFLMKSLSLLSKPFIQEKKMFQDVYTRQLNDSRIQPNN